MRAMQPVPAAPELCKLEHEILAFWQESRAFQRLQELGTVEHRPLFRFVDGPITANNPMGVHHAWGRTLKDVFLRYKSRTGHAAVYQNGFDTQGLWVEVEVEKAIGSRGKPDIEKFGIDNFCRKCRERVETFAQVITNQSIRLGQWMDWENSYYTHRDQNILGIWAFLKECHRRGWLYQKGLPMPWCYRCGTSLSEHEMAGSHQDLEHLSVYVLGALKEDAKRKLLFWTTTPWTLSANVAAAVNPKLTYAEVSSPQWDYTVILSKDALDKVKEFRPKVMRTFPGEDLLGKIYEPFFPELKRQAEVEHRVVPWDQVDAVEGSGIVHIAPGCGREDYELGQSLGLPVISPVDGNGVYFPDFGCLAEKHVADVAQEVADHLKESGKLLKAEHYTHSYPVCWRCKTPLIFRLVKEWFISCQEIRPKMLEAARTVVWAPEHVGKSMEDWLTNMGDWCISRKRYWGLPLPFYICKPCGQMTVVGSLEELKSLAVNSEEVDQIPELHRPWIDKVKIRCPHCARELSRVLEVGDCWLDAGIVPYTTLGYFDNREEWKKKFPAEWICEMREQVRLWFYSMLFMGVTLSERAPYERVLAYESVVSEEGTRFSKTGLMIRFDDAVEQTGADAMRYLYSSRPVGTDLRFSFDLVRMASRKILDLWNIYAFFVNYALIDQPKISEEPPRNTLAIADRWLLARTSQMIEAAQKSYEAYDTPNVLREMEGYLDDISNWYVRVSRRRFWRAGHAEDKRACYWALYSALRATVLALSPVIPFVTERIWQNAIQPLDGAAAESVHHAKWPLAPAEFSDTKLIERTATVRQVIRLGLKVRSEASIRVRQPIAAMYVAGPFGPAIEEQLPLIQSELNVKELHVVDDTSLFYIDRLDTDLKVAGAALRGDAAKLKSILREMGAEEMASLARRVKAGEEVTVPGIERVLKPEVFRVMPATNPRFGLASEGSLTVALDLEIPEPLKQEGLVRDLVRHIQVLRRDSGLSLTQRIELGLSTESSKVRDAIEQHRAYIMEEVLAESLEEDSLRSPRAQVEMMVAEQPVVATVRW